jgi:hypothetical protein
MVEVETTLVPNEECHMQDVLTSPTGKRSQRRVLTKVCTKYVPHKPSVYEVYRALLDASGDTRGQESLA